MQSLPVRATDREIGKYQGLTECLERRSCPSSLSMYEEAVTHAMHAYPRFIIARFLLVGFSPLSGGVSTGQLAGNRQ
jgi:hypothetical protein